MLLELELEHNNEPLDLDSNMTNLNVNFESDTNSGDIPYEDDDEEKRDVEFILNKMNGGAGGDGKYLDVSGSFKHSRSHSDCTGLVQSNSLHHQSNRKNDATAGMMNNFASPIAVALAAAVPPVPSINKPVPSIVHTPDPTPLPSIEIHQKISAKIINTAIHCEGQYAVYAIQVYVIEGQHQKSWHIYRRYSRFLELKKTIVKRVIFYFIN